MTSVATSWNAIDHALLNTSLDKLLLSPIFDKSPRQQDLLRYLVKETLAGNAERLKGYTLGAVSYTHLDVYKRQLLDRWLHFLLVLKYADRLLVHRYTHHCIYSL